jgi:pimeloyl-ACP methyl ester carboxylesterase
MPEELELVVGDLRFRAMAEGPEDGELVLLLHGFPQSWWEWRHQMAALAAAGLRAVAPDQRGYSPGARPEGVEAYHVDRLVEDVLGMADALGAARFHLVGHDWGAIVAWHVAVAAPERLESLTIVSVPHPAAFARALADRSSEQAGKSSYIIGFQEPGAGDGMVADDGAGLRFAFQASGLDDDVDEHVRVLTQPGAIEAALNWYRAFDFHGGGLADVEVPTLFVWSTDDIAIAEEGAAWTADHVTGPYRYEVFDGVSHWVPEVAADRLSDLLRWRVGVSV